MKSFLDGLSHAVEMEGERFAIGTGLAEDLKGLVLGGGGEGKEADIGLFAPFCHSPEDFLLVVR